MWTSWLVESCLPTETRQKRHMGDLVVVMVGMTFIFSRVPLLRTGSLPPDPSCPWTAATTSTPLPPLLTATSFSLCLLCFMPGITQLHYLPPHRPPFISLQMNTTKLTQIHHLIWLFLLSLNQLTEEALGEYQKNRKNRIIKEISIHIQITKSSFLIQKLH